MAGRIPNIKIENAKIIFRNFSGHPGPYNRKGHRSFNVIIDDAKYAEMLHADGWNIKPLPPKDDNDEKKYRLEVAVAFANVPPKIILVSNKKKTPLNEETVGALDYADIENVDLVISPYPWEINGKTGIKAFVKTMYVTIKQDEFADKYGDDDFTT